jgi:hypothetical protein
MVVLEIPNVKSTKIRSKVRLKNIDGTIDP